MESSASAGTGAGTFGILLFTGLEELDAIGPWEMASLWSRQASGPGECLLPGQRALGDVEVVKERYSRSGNVGTSAGISSGIDLSLRFISETAGEDGAGQVQQAAEYFPSSKTYGSAASSAKGSAWFQWP